MASIAVTNNGDSTVDIVVSGSTGAWTIYSVDVHKLASGSFGVLVAGSGDQTVASQPIANTGGWLFYIANGAVVSTPTYRLVTGIEDETWHQCLQAIASRISLLGLDGVNPQRIEARKQPLDSRLAKIVAAAQQPGSVDASPAILVTPIPETKPAKQYNGLRRVDYGCRISTFIGNDYDPAKWLPRQLLWRRKISDEFDQKTLVEVPQVEVCRVTPGDVFSIGHFVLGYDVQVLDVRCTACHPT